MSWKFTLPSKTFLLGEYLVLTGGPALLLNTAPYFQCDVRQTDVFTESKLFSSIHPSSPAGRFLQQHINFFKNFAINFYDPHQGKGGFGASSAQFAAVALFKDSLEKPTTQTNYQLTTATIFTLLQAYQACAWDDKGLPPSGADVAAQCIGSTVIMANEAKQSSSDNSQLCFVDRQQQQLTNMAWPFKDLAFFLLRTGHKVATHEHLQTLTHIPSEKLNAVMQSALQAINEKNAMHFVKAINAYAVCLQQVNFVAATSQTILKKLWQQPQVLAAKGCGALGADVILVLTAVEGSTSFANWAEKQAIEIVVRHG